MDTFLHDLRHAWRMMRRSPAFTTAAVAALALGIGGDPAIVGRTISLNNEPHDVIGVLGPFDTEAIQSQAGPADVWLPFQIDPHSVMQGHFFIAGARLKPGMTLAAAETQLQRAAVEFR